MRISLAGFAYTTKAAQEWQRRARQGEEERAKDAAAKRELQAPQ